MLTARTIFYDAVNDIEEVELGTHILGFGGQGDGYCYAHQSFDCLENLTFEERTALNHMPHGDDADDLLIGYDD